MPLQSSGAISLSQIKTELGSGSNSLRALSAAAEKSAPDAFSEFYGYSAVTNYTFTIGAGSTTFFKNYWYGVVTTASPGLLGQMGTINGGTGAVTIGGLTFTSVASTAISTGGVTLQIGIVGTTSASSFTSITYPTASNLADITVASSAFTHNTNIISVDLPSGNQVSSGTFTLTI